MEGAPDYDRVAELFTRAVQLDANERLAFLERACGDDVRLRREVETMLRFDDVDTPDVFTDSRLLEGRRALDRTASDLIDGLPGAIGRWRVGRRVAIRGGETILALEREDDGALAWLIVHDERASPQVVERVLRSGDALAALAHDGLVPVHEVGLVDARGGKKPYRVTAVPPGRSMHRYLSDHRPDLGERLELVARVADALEAAHRAGFAHRLLSPRCVLVREDGSPLVTGLGRAHFTDCDLREPTSRSLAHRAPEQARQAADEVGVATDVHALGLLLHDVLTGRPAYDVVGRRTRDALRIVCEEDPPPLSRPGLALPPAVEEVARRALAKRPADRFPSAAAFAEALRAAAARASRPSRRAVTFLLLAGAVLAAAAVAVLT